VGYDSKRECYRVRTRDGTVIVSRDVIFKETEFTVERDRMKWDARSEDFGFEEGQRAAAPVSGGKEPTNQSQKDNETEMQDIEDPEVKRNEEAVDEPPGHNGAGPKAMKRKAELDGTEKNLCGRKRGEARWPKE